MQPFSYIKIIKFFIPVKTVLLDLAVNLIVDAFSIKPHDKSSNRILFGKTG